MDVGGMNTDVFSRFLPWMGTDAATGPVLPVGPDGTELAALQHAREASEQDKLEKLAVGFESMFWSLVLKEMRQTLEPGQMFGHDSGDVLGGMFDMFMSQHLSQAQVLGIASMVKRQLEQTGAHDQPPHFEDVNRRPHAVADLPPSS